MAFTVTFENADGYLRFEVSGVRVARTLARDMLDVWKRVAAECRARSAARVLGINRLTGPVPTLEVFHIGQEVPGILGPDVRRLAFVVLGGEEALSANRFFEDVAVNRGLAGRVFGEEAEAIAWLTAP